MARAVISQLEVTQALEDLLSKNLRLAEEGNALDWRRVGEQLWSMHGQVEQADQKIQYALGDWYNAGNKFDREAIVASPDWQGPTLKTCRNLAAIAAKVEHSRRRETLPFSHQAEAAGLPPELADRYLDQIEQRRAETGILPPSREIRQQVKRERRDLREEAMAEATARASKKIGKTLYNVILADPPWRFVPYSQTTGMDRAAENHYGTMPTQDICDLKERLPLAKDCVLFLWRRADMQRDAAQVAEAWDFKIVSEWVWAKDRPGLGYWGRYQHEVLLICTRGKPVAPAPGTQPATLIRGKVGAHSSKPEIFHELIEEMYPTVPKLELFARRFRLKWHAWGNEMPPEFTEAAE